MSSQGQTVSYIYVVIEETCRGGYTVWVQGRATPPPLVVFYLFIYLFIYITSPFNKFTQNDMYIIQYKTKTKTIQYNTIQYNTIQYNTIQYNTIQYNTIQYNTIQYNTIQYKNKTIQSNTRQYSINIYSSV